MVYWTVQHPGVRVPDGTGLSYRIRTVEFPSGEAITGQTGRNSDNAEARDRRARHYGDGDFFCELGLRPGGRWSISPRNRQKNQDRFWLAGRGR